MRGVGKSVRRSSKSEGGGVPTIQDETADGWWARRKSAFAHPTESIFKRSQFSNNIICRRSCVIPPQVCARFTLIVRPSEKRGRRESRVLSSHPRPVCIGRKHTVVTTGGAGSSGLPCAMVLTAYIALS